MAFKGPAYGLSAELKLKSEAKYDPEEAKKCLNWINQVTSAGLDLCKCKTDDEFAEQLKDGQALCKLINAIAPGSVKKINTMKMPFKQRENIELYLKGAADYGLKEQDLFQVSLANYKTGVTGVDMMTRFNPQGERPLRVEEPVHGGGQPVLAGRVRAEAGVRRAGAGGQAGVGQQAAVRRGDDEGGPGRHRAAVRHQQVRQPEGHDRPRHRQADQARR